MMPLVSILIPAYNAEKWVRDSIESAINQTWPRKEIIIVDDGSKDNTCSIVAKYQSGLVKVVSQENKGASAARNAALYHAQGDFIQWLDADDLLHPGKITAQMNKLDHGRDSGILLTSSFGYFYYRIEKAKFFGNELYCDLNPIDYFMLKFIHNAMIATDAWLVDRKLTELAGPWDERLSLDDDGEYFCRVAAASEVIKFVPEAVSYVRRGNFSSLSRKMTDEALESLMLSTSLCIDHLIKIEDSERTRNASIKYLQYQLYYIYPEKQEAVRKAEALAKDMGGILVLKETWKFHLIRKIFRWRLAKMMKEIIWSTQILIFKNLDKLSYHLFRRQGALSKDRHPVATQKQA